MGAPIKGEGRLIRVFNETSVTSAASATSTSVDVSDSSYLGLWYQATPSSAGSGVRIYYEMSYDDTTTNFVIPDGVGDIDTSFDSSAAHVNSIQPPPMRYLRLRATCTSADQSDLKLTTWLFKQ